MLRASQFITTPDTREKQMVSLGVKIFVSFPFPTVQLNRVLQQQQKQGYENQNLHLTADKVDPGEFFRPIFSSHRDNRAAEMD